MTTSSLQPLFFATPAQWRKWLEKNHKKATEVIVGFYKKSTGKKSITWPESVDEALCFGWIDGIRRTIDEESYNIRFTPRKPASIWSAINIAKVEALKKEGKMTAAGLAAYELRKEHKSRVYAFEQGEVELDKAYEQQLRANKKAWAFFNSKGASYRKIAKWWVMSARQEATRQKRLATLISDSEAGRLIPTQRAGRKDK